MTEHRHRYEPSPLVPGYEVCKNVGFGKCEIPERRVPTMPAPAQEHSEESKAAARSQSATKLHRDRLMVFTALKTAGIDGATDEELQLATGLDGNTERPRRIELVKENLITRHGTRPTTRGKAAAVWIVRDFLEHGYPQRLVAADGQALVHMNEEPESA